MYGVSTPTFSPLGYHISMYENMITQRREGRRQKSTQNFVLKKKLSETGISSIKRTVKVRKE